MYVTKGILTVVFLFFAYCSFDVARDGARDKDHPTMVFGLGFFLALVLCTTWMWGI